VCSQYFWFDDRYCSCPRTCIVCAASKGVGLANDLCSSLGGPFHWDWWRLKQFLTLGGCTPSRLLQAPLANHWWSPPLWFVCASENRVWAPFVPWTLGATSLDATSPDCATNLGTTTSPDGATSGRCIAAPNGVLHLMVSYISWWNIFLMLCPMVVQLHVFLMRRPSADIIVEVSIRQHGSKHYIMKDEIN
jgi:hypothetical protein